MDTTKITEDFLKDALALTSEERHSTHGDKIRNHCNIASLWSAYLGKEITARDVALMMALLKIARTKLGNHNRDDYIDGAGYVAIAGEIADDNSVFKPKQLELDLLLDNTRHHKDNDSEEK